MNMTKLTEQWQQKQYTITLRNFMGRKPKNAREKKTNSTTEEHEVCLYISDEVFFPKLRFFHYHMQPNRNELLTLIRWKPKWRSKLRKRFWPEFPFMWKKCVSVGSFAVYQNLEKKDFLAKIWMWSKWTIYCTV